MDCTLVRAYRKAYELKQEQANAQAWLQAAYIYDTLMRVAPVYQAFNKRPRPKPFLEKPFDLMRKQEKPRTSYQETQKVIASRTRFEMMICGINEKFKQKGGEADGGN